MKKICHSNYEAFLLDYSEGKLSAEYTADLLLFLEQYPELKVDLYGFSDAVLNPEPTVKADFKNQLYKSKSQLEIRFQKLSIAFYDQSISAAEKQELDYLMLQFPSFENEFKVFGDTYLQPDCTIEFSAKSGLKKQFIPVNGFEYQAISELEGLLSTDESKLFHSSIQNSPQLNTEWEAFGKTRLPKETIPFLGKKTLYKKSSTKRVPIYWARTFSVAASLFLIFGLFYILNQKHRSVTIQSASFDGNSNRSAKLSTPNSNLSFVKPVAFNNNPVKKQDSFLNKTKQINPINTTPSKSELVIPNDLAELQSKPALIEEPFELEANFLSQTIEGTRLLGEFTENRSSNENPTLVRFLGNLFRSAARNKGFNLPTDFNKENLTRNGTKGLEQLTNGVVSITHDETPNGRRINGFSIGSLAIRRSTGNN